MSRRSCPPPHELVHALRHGTLGRDVEAHGGSCQECGEILRLADSLQAASQPFRPVPSFASLQWKIRARAILEESRRRNQRATGPLRSFHLVAGLSLIAAMLFLMVAPFFDSSSFGGLASLGPLPGLLAAAMGTHLFVVGRDRSGLNN